jgi:DNA polymerase III subunit delta'
VTASPNSNWDMIGHEWAVQLLRGHVAREKTRHAYLFTGPQGVGRRTLALRLAQALNCPQPLVSGEPCRSCRSCQQIERMQYPDLTVIRSEQPGGTLKVDQVRELQHSLSLAPYAARYRVALLLNFEEANPNAANALLKTLEEPHSQVILILTAESAERLLPTIVSRCEVLRLRPLSLEVINQGLQAQAGVPAEQAGLLAHLSGGRPGYALNLFQQPERLSQRQTRLAELSRLLASSRFERFVYAEAISKDKEELREALQVWLSFWRDVLLQAAGASAPIANIDRANEIGMLANRLNLPAAHHFVNSLERTFDYLDQNVNTRLVVEVLLLDLPLL